MEWCYMNNDNSVALSKYRLEKSKECLKSAKALRDIDELKQICKK